MYEFNFELDDFQKEAVKYIDEGKSVVVSAPTGAGKTCIAEHAIHRALQDGTKLIYTTPLKALSNQKFSDFGRKYGEDKVGLLTGDTSINREAQIVVMTTEVFRNMLYGTNLGELSKNLKGVKYAVLDEVHYMNDEERGTVWEESIIYCPTDIQIIALSATVANAEQLCGWINTVHSDTECVYTDFRPVPLKFYYYDSSKPFDVLPLLTPDGQLNKKIRPERRDKNFKKRSNQRNTAKDVISALHKKDMLPAIYFTFSRKKCDEQMEKCCDIDLITKEEAREIHEIVTEYLRENPYLAGNKHLDCIYHGVASHHAGLLPGWKVLVEKLFQKGLIKVVFATETLAAGINMPARSTVISSISKRTDNGHRLLTANEFLQMSGRAGRRGMDKVGYVTVVGTAFQTPDEVAELVLSEANPLESRFSPKYSMVLNLLQKFSISESKELILKSFGYYSSTDRLKPLLLQKEETDKVIEKLSGFVCPYNLTHKDLLEYNKTRETYVVHRKLSKTLIKQAKQKGQKDLPDVAEFLEKTKGFLTKMKSYHCDICRNYKKHMKDIEVLDRYEKKASKLSKNIANEKDIYWNKFISHKNVLSRMGYLDNDFPNEKGILCSTIRSENELYISEILLSGVLDNLTPAQLSAVVCSLITEDLRGDVFPSQPISSEVRKTLNQIKNIRRKIAIVQRDYDIDTEMFLNSYYSPLIEMWVNGLSWEELTAMTESSEGDVVRVFKRTIDILRQIANAQYINPQLNDTAKEAIKAILREPIDVD
ncbi:MAG: DEAD/DEAH box helicase [Candidatus Gastranaerophilaceae bacterium]